MGLEKHPVLVSVLVSKKLSGLGLGLGLEACGLDYNTGVKNKPASLLVVPLGKALGGIPPSWCGRQMAGNS